ncbi:MAG: two-component system, OmpR family, sensor kinase [Solirubrobacteraceae bacterium]|nr:two-component system, OmpR family, sensor kinase [Solirubrobacteraceae bacterium]
MSLRARLIIGLVSLAAVGLLLAGAVTYVEQHDFLFERVDAQADQAIAVVDGDLRDHHVGGPPIRDVPGAGEPDPLTGGASDHGPGPGGRRPYHDPGRERERVNLPSTIFGQGRDAAGHVLLSRRPLLPAGATAASTPKLPAVLHAGERLTVDAEGSSGQRYRVLVQPSATGGLTIAAVPIDIEDSLSTLLVTQAIVIGGVLLALAAAASWIVRLGLRPLERIGETAGAIAGGDLTRRVDQAQERTEVGRLGLALNAMLARLEEAFAERRASEERLRRFLADASHELRTPLASIRGYAELFRIGAAHEGPELEKAMRRIEAESARMGVLVEDLLALARLDEVPDAHRERVDLAALAADAVADARAVAPEREITLRGDRPVLLDGDPGQLRQVLSNLVRNALVHTPAGTPIEVEVGPDGADAVLEVRDHGPGLPAGDPAELFERFWRADPGRGRGRAGAGLGLSIVAAIVGAHGGRARAADADGGGARFTVTLPLRATAASTPAD